MYQIIQSNHFLSLCTDREDLIGDDEAALDCQEQEQDLEAEG